VFFQGAHKSQSAVFQRDGGMMTCALDCGIQWKLERQQTQN